ncbi:hypothetical protein P691DRAFT_658377 [Macrolepiota fuliginosa MF-IS2]|uniref:RING-type E3 ubiquitin transferase n=1 Tax=Macrolepiota fuliginosa MF-IS2 TaxID=1400762 RepID=A0A9P5XLC2_9AGAR|nr:hypothetical protein P691DRAFT_658377 [Macrolepiota fuliginosa MF-IS2]
MSSNIRPRTSKPRGICKYYTLPRGCFAGSACKFLHGDPEHHDSRGPKHLLTPYDESKRCKYYANGFCRHGDHCWFKHTTDDAPPVSCDVEQRSDDQQDEPCSICFEKPVTYGLLSGCSHIFCITCIRQWRDQKGQIEHGNIKKCPMCREPSKFITPSSRFWRHGHPEKERVTKAYKESMARVSCRYFQRSRQMGKTQPLCPFGKDCFYQHLNDDGTPHIFKNGADVCMRVSVWIILRDSLFETCLAILQCNTACAFGVRRSYGIHNRILSIDRQWFGGSRYSGNILDAGHNRHGHDK